MSQNKQCAYCHAILFEDDDVVFCPECGAAHHRECYNELGHCAREQFHGTESAEPDTDREEEEASRPSGIPRDREGRICRKCGSISSSDTLFCPYCGTSFNQSDESGDTSAAKARPPFVIPGIDPYGGVDPASDVEGVTASELAIYVRVNSNVYLPKFEKLAKKNKKVGWNWAGFIFTYAWLFYRKCYFAGLVSILFTVISYILSVPYYAAFLNAVDALGITDLSRLTSDQSTAIILDTVNGIDTVGWVMIVASIALTLIIRIAVAMFGNRIYLEKSKSKIGKIKADDNIQDKVSTIAAAGGANIISAFAIFYAMTNVVANLVVTLFC